MSARELRFAVRADQSCSPSWKVRVGATHPDIYVTNRATGSMLHVSLHESGWWHVKWQSESSGLNETRRWKRPAELAPGFTRALNLIVTPAVIDQPLPRKRIIWFQAPGQDRWSHFDVWLEHPRANRNDSWPGKNAMGTKLVGRMPLPNGETVCVTAHDEAGESGQAVLPNPEGVRGLARIRKGLLGMKPGHLAVLVPLEDGTMRVMHGPYEIGPMLRSRIFWVKWTWGRVHRLWRK